MTASPPVGVFNLLATFLLRRLLAAAALILISVSPSTAFAQASGCTALWGISNAAGASIGYFNRNTNAFVNVAAPTAAVLTANGVVGTSGNALGVFGGDGTLYFSNHNTRANVPGMLRATFDNVAGTVTFTNQGAITIPPRITYTTAANTQATATTTLFIGATFDNSDNVNKLMYLVATSNVVGDLPITGTNNTTGTVAMLGLLNPDFPNSVSWQTIVQTTATGTVTYPFIGNSGDLYYDRTNAAIFYLSNSVPNRLMRIEPNRTGGILNSALITSTASFSAGATTGGGLFGIALDPGTNNTYVVNNAGGNFLVDSTTLNTSAVTSVAVGVGSGYGDTGSCVTQPLLPTITKSFNPTSSGEAIGTSTVTVTINNPNLVPVFTTTSLTDALPANMVIANPLSTSVQCFSNGGAATRPLSTTITAVVAANSFGIPSGAFIAGGNPGGGSCSFSVVVSTTIPNIYPNVIPAGSLTTTAGTNTLAAQGTYTLRVSDFQVLKYQNVGLGGVTTTNTLTVPGASTLQYILTISNSGPVTGSTTFTDTIPALLTPSLAAITAISSGGAGCTTATAVVAGQLVLTGTLTNAPLGGACVVTVTLRGSSTLSTQSSATNTITISGSPTFSGGVGSDFVTGNNTASVLTIVGPSANIAVSKTNGTDTVIAGGTTSYTVTIVNLGPADAGGTTFKDPVSAGLTCTNVSCSATAANICPASPTISAMQGAGLLLSPNFPAGSTASFVIDCGVTATGQ